MFSDTNNRKKTSIIKIKCHKILQQIIEDIYLDAVSQNEDDYFSSSSFYYLN